MAIASTRRAIELDADRLRPRWHADAADPSDAGRRSTPCSSAGAGRRTPSSTTSTTAAPRRRAWTSCASGALEARAEHRLAAGDIDGLVAELTGARRRRTAARATRVRC